MTDLYLLLIAKIVKNSEEIKLFNPIGLNNRFELN